MGRLVRNGLGVLAGYVSMAVLSTAMTMLMRALFEVARSEDPPPGYVLFDLSYGLLFACVGGWVAARIARSRLAAYVLAALSFVAVGGGALAGWDTVHAIEYQWAAAILSPAAILLGAYLARVEGEAAA